MTPPKTEFVLTGEDINFPDVTQQIHLLQQSIDPVLNKYRAALREARTRIEIIGDDYECLHRRNPIHSISSRLKAPESILGKMTKHGVPLTLEAMEENIFDIAGIRVICSYVEDAYTIFELISRQDDVSIMRVRDYIHNPKSNGYRSLHLTIRVPVFFLNSKEYIPVEIQIRTIAMDYWASLEHDLRYKPLISNAIDISSELVECSDVLSCVESRMQKMFKMIETHDRYPTQ